MAQTSFNSRDNFATSLQQYDTAIPLRTQFIAFFDNIPPIVNTKNLQGFELIQGDKVGWNIDAVRSLLVDWPENSQKAGCIFVGGASIPSENLNSSSAAIENNRGFLQGTILEGRDAYASNQLTIQFRETNSSFTDFILRPWLIMAAHKGFVARPLSESIKTNITIIQFSKFIQGAPSILRKIWKYYDCVPTAVDTRTLTYAGAWRSAMYAANMLMLMPNGSSVYNTSTNGVSWTARSLPSSGGFYVHGWNGTVALAVSAGTTLAYTSTDGINWTTRTLPASTGTQQMVYSPSKGQFLYTINGVVTAYTSPDGVTWTQRNMPTGAQGGGFLNSLAGSVMIAGMDHPTGQVASIPVT